MILGSSQIDITPQPGVELSGFAARTQPSTGVLDPLFARALYLTEGEEKLLWIHCDLVGFERAIVQEFRGWAQKALGLREAQVMLSATHTHSGACTIHLREAGTYDPGYVEFLQGRLRESAKLALARTEPVDLVTVEGRLELAVDRRKSASAHTDPRVAALGFRRADATFAGVIVNFPMHAVALGPANRCISADVPGQVALTLTRRLPGNPTVLVTNGACANLNPPAENVPFAQIEAWGKEIADVVAPLLAKGRSVSCANLRVLARTVPLPVDSLDIAGINAYAQKALTDAASLAAWGDKYRRVVEHWRSSLISDNQAGGSTSHRDAELFIVGLGEVTLLGANAEVFSEFTDWLRRHTRKRVYLIGYANGDIGYLPTRAAYAEGGYEVEVAHLFYGGFRPKAGGLELLATAATDLLGELQADLKAKGGVNGKRSAHQLSQS